MWSCSTDRRRSSIDRSNPQGQCSHRWISFFTLTTMSFCTFLKSTSTAYLYLYKKKDTWIPQKQKPRISISRISKRFIWGQEQEQEQDPDVLPPTNSRIVRQALVVVMRMGRVWEGLQETLIWCRGGPIISVERRWIYRLKRRWCFISIRVVLRGGNPSLSIFRRSRTMISKRSRSGITRNRSNDSGRVMWGVLIVGRTSGKNGRIFNIRRILISSFRVFPHSHTPIQEYRRHQGVCFWILLRSFIKSERVSRCLFLPLLRRREMVDLAFKIKSLFVRIF